MLPNIDSALYAKFKAEGYRIKKHSRFPIQHITEIVQLAYVDVNRTIRGIDLNQSYCFKQGAVSLIERILTLPSMDQAQFDALHHEFCKQCIACSSPTVAIHYGQAQKLINMSLKYLYNEFANYQGSQNHFGFPSNSVECLFHLPIDSQIRDCLVRSRHFTDPTRLAWSRWTYDDYIGFQRELRQRLKSRYKPLEVDYILWNASRTAAAELFEPPA